MCTATSESRVSRTRVFVIFERFLYTIEEVGVALLVTVFRVNCIRGRPRAGVAAVRGRRAGRTSSSTSRSVAPPARPSPSTLPAAHITHTVHATRITRNDSITQITGGRGDNCRNEHTLSLRLSAELLALATQYMISYVIVSLLGRWQP